MKSDLDLETRLRAELRRATDDIRAAPGFWDDVDQRMARRRRRARIGRTALAGAGLAAVVGLAATVVPTALPGVDIAPTAPNAPSSEPDAVDVAAEARERQAEVARLAEAAQEREQALRELLREPGRDGQPTPIEGYGDFSDVDPFVVDVYEVMRLTAACISDQGYTVELSELGDSIHFLDTDPVRNAEASLTLDACMAGLGVPEQTPPLTASQRETAHAYQTAIWDCLVDAGLELQAPPSPEHQLGGDPVRSAYDRIRIHGDPSPADAYVSMREWTQLQLQCPPQPVGGFAAWSPGDAVTPVQLADRQQ